MQLDRASTRTLSIDSNLLGIPTEASNMFLDPFKGLDLVKKARVEVPVGCVSERRRCEEAERGETVVYRDGDNVGALIDPVVERPVPRIAVDVT